MKTTEDAERLLGLARQADERSVELKRQARSYVLEAHACGASWSEIGAAFGITRQAAHERFQASTALPGMLFDTAPQMVITQRGFLRRVSWR